MAERKAVNKYYPVEWDPSKGSINAFQGVHALRDRARKLHMGIMIIRFEMPYNVWCEGCGAHIGMGVRFNAEKKKAGNYYSTTIYSFRMKCHLCSNWMEIHTDPKNAQYVCVSGVRKKEEYTDACGIILQSDEEILKRKENAFYRLEHGVQDEVVAKERVPHLTQLLGLSQRDWQNPYETSRKLRRKFREEKKQLAQHRSEAQSVQDKHCLSIPILPPSQLDTEQAKSVVFDSGAKEMQQQRLLTARVGPLFGAVPSGLAGRLQLAERLKRDPFLHK